MAKWLIFLVIWATDGPFSLDCPIHNVTPEMELIDILYKWDEIYLNVTKYDMKIIWKMSVLCQTLSRQ